MHAKIKDRQLRNDLNGNEDGLPTPKAYEIITLVDRNRENVRVHGLSIGHRTTKTVVSSVIH